MGCVAVVLGLTQFCAQHEGNGVIRGVRVWAQRQCFFPGARPVLGAVLGGPLVWGGGVVGEVKQFSYLGDVLECGGGSERAIRARVEAAWGKWKEIASLLVNRGILLHHRRKVYEACIRSVMLYGGRRGHLLQHWRLYCLVVIEECSGIWLESRGGIV